MQKTYINKFNKLFNEAINDLIPGGLASGLNINNVEKYHGLVKNSLMGELSDGIEIELEHTNDIDIAKEIATDHLMEDPHYYTKLKDIESNDTVNDTVNGNKIIYIDENDILNNYIYELDSFLSNTLNINEKPSIKLINFDINNSKDDLGTTAYYEPNNKEIVLYTYGRAIKDILRSFAHEYIHHKQNLENRLNNINTTNINEDDYLKTIEEEAYLNGNILFRAWENKLKNK